MDKYKKIKITNPILNLYPVYCDKIYSGREPMRVVGIRQNSIELEGDYSGIGYDLSADWFSTKDCFMIKKVCPETLKTNGCQVHNIHCCGDNNILSKHEEYWK